MAVIGSIKELYEGHIVTFNVSDLKTDGTGLPVKYDVVSLVDGKIVKAIAQKNVTNNNLLGIIAEVDVVGTNVSTSGMSDNDKKPYDTGVLFSLTKTF